MSELLKINLDGAIKQVSRKDYVEAKTRQLVEFGYALTPKEVDEELTALIAGKQLGDGLTVIGMFMADEVVLK